MKDEKMTEDALLSLKSLRPAAPSPEARKLALNAAMVAFDAAQAAKPKARASGGWLSRWKLGAGLGIPVGTAVAALFLVPLGTQLVSTSHQVDGPPGELAIATNSAVQDEAARTRAPEPAQEMAAKEATTGRAEAPLADAELLAAPAPSPTTLSTRALTRAAPSATADMAYGGGVFAQPQAPLGDTFKSFDENRVKITREEPVSTFSIDVDTASYAYVRSLLQDGYLPDPDAVRIEEMINYFPYDYRAPESLDVPFASSLSLLPTPWNPRTELLRIGIKGYVPPAEARQPQSLTFLIDTSGSMDEPNKLPLLKRAFGLLVDTLRADDSVSIVVYAGSAGVVLEPTRASERAKILGALDRLAAGGSTAGAEGLALAYRLAAESRVENGVNRVILATDGDFNVGLSDPEDLKTYIRSERDKGIFLSVLGFGRGNLDDALMQSLAQNGNGNASYIDSFREANKVLVEEGGANLVTIAKDVKIQVEFNPAVVSEYRLIGYETRALNREDFNNDAVDAGDIGAGHTVTALYELTPAGSGAELNEPLRYGTTGTGAMANEDEFGFLKLRYKAPEGDASKLIEMPIGTGLVRTDIAEASADQRFAAAVAAFGQKLKGSVYGTAMSWDDIAALANGAKGNDVNGYRAEFVQMVHLAALLSPDKSGGGRAKGDDPTLMLNRALGAPLPAN
jgi:Ca-activated chloride channel family protein